MSSTIIPLSDLYTIANDLVGDRLAAQHLVRYVTWLATKSDDAVAEAREQPDRAAFIAAHSPGYVTAILNSWVVEEGDQQLINQVRNLDPSGRRAVGDFCAEVIHRASNALDDRTCAWLDLHMHTDYIALHATTSADEGIAVIAETAGVGNNSDAVAWLAYCQHAEDDWDVMPQVGDEERWRMFTRFHLNHDATPDEIENAYHDAIAESDGEYAFDALLALEARVPDHPLAPEARKALHAYSDAMIRSLTGMGLEEATATAVPFDPVLLADQLRDADDADTGLDPNLSSGVHGGLPVTAPELTSGTPVTNAGRRR
ncbi:hypothetical protein AB0I28_33050 [Phytomonospora sp. NPDC050363]|uniref:hypothetical protein n=1 Tax=Phytomonospora sp. NPDC050363 TaxID=3155642 RepID=UPI003407AD01